MFIINISFFLLFFYTIQRNEIACQADKLKKSLESENLSLQERVNELEAECSIKRKEAASAAARQEEVYTASLSEMALLKEENSSKMCVLTFE